MQGLNWGQFEDIGIALYEKFPDVDPLKVRFTDLLKWVIELEDFEGDPAASNEAKLEAVQMAWYEEWKENQ
ncbi:MAG: Fe-S cluster assembly protein IscX [Acidobacteriia bacterium]|nr:Fe-S cluster assembly protein IscX [Terriglobia bacterium]